MQTTNQVRALRRRPTDAERRLWSLLRARRFVGYKFRRQQPIGRFVVDFVCIGRRIVIEVDGDSHTRTVDRDEQRTRWLMDEGYRVLRFSDRDVLSQTDGVAEAILLALAEPLPPFPAR